MRRILICILLLPLLTHAQNITWGEEDTFLEIGDKLSVLEDETGRLTFDKIRSESFANNFKPSTKINLSLGYTESFFWLRFTVDNRSKNNLVLEIAQAGLPITDFYYLKDSTIEHVKAGYEVPISKKVVKSSFQVFSIPPGVRTYYVRLNSNSEPVPVRLYDQSTYEIKSTKQNFSYGIYLGLMLFVAIINLFFFALLKSKMQLFYSFIVLLYISYSAAVIDGYIVYFFPANLIFLYTTIPSIGVTVQTFYCLQFLEAKKYTPKLFKVIMGIVIYFGVWAILKFFFSFPVVQPINTANALISFFAMGYVGVKVGSNGNKFGYYFAIAYFIYFLLVVAQAVYINTGSPEYVGGLSHVAYATLIEAFLLSFLLSKRVEWEKEEVERAEADAKHQLLEKTLENERIVRDQNITLEVKVKERTRELEENKKKLHDLMHLIAHDLKAPFANIKTLLALYKRKDRAAIFSTEETVEMIGEIAYKSESLIQKLLNTQNFNQEAYNLKLETIDIAKVAVEVVGSYQTIAGNKNIEINFRADATMDHRATVDKVYLRQVFDNLVNNAIKFSPPDTQVRITIEANGKCLRTIIKDEGPGIKDEEKKMLFQKFTKLSNRPTGGEASSGLGLSIVKHYVELLNGNVFCESENGQGCSFIVELPRSISN